MIFHIVRKKTFIQINMVLNHLQKNYTRR